MIDPTDRPSASGDRLRVHPITLEILNRNAVVLQQPNLQHLILRGSFVSVAPLVVTFLLLPRLWTTGLSAGAIT